MEITKSLLYKGVPYKDSNLFKVTCFNVLLTMALLCSQNCDISAEHLTFTCISKQMLRVGAIHEAQKQLSFTFGPIFLQLDRLSKIEGRFFDNVLLVLKYQLVPR